MKIKICGVTHPDDAFLAAQLGADYIGIIFSPKSKRKVTLDQAKKIAEAAKKGGAQTVGVFVDETADEIVQVCKAVEIDLIQVYGSKGPLPRPIIYALVAGESIPVSNYLIIEGSERGVPFDWKSFNPPKNRNWFLAGGLTPGNVAEAIAILRPYGVDVSSGIETPNLRKDPRLVEQFIQQVRL